MQERERLMAVCGLGCTDCALRCADTDIGAAESLVGWFRGEGWLEAHEGAADVMQRGPYCRGCHGDRSIHWSADCWILHCCVDEKGLAYCYECAGFPCDRLAEWAAQNARYTEALQRQLRIWAVEAAALAPVSHTQF